MPDDPAMTAPQHDMEDVRPLAADHRALARMITAREGTPGRWRKYPRSPTKVRVMSVDRHTGTISIERKAGGRTTGASITHTMLAAAAEALVPGKPVDIEELLKGTNNTRSALEALLLLLVPECHLCRVPGPRSRPRKHVVYLPGRKHRIGRVSEVPWTEIEPAVIDVQPPSPMAIPESEREHTSVQAMLALIGHRLGYDVCIARNDLSTVVGGKPLSRHPGVKPIRETAPFKGTPLPEDVDLVDVVWICKNRRLVAAMFEVEFTTGVVNGLTRMRCVLESSGRPRTKRHVVVVKTKGEARALRKANRADFAKLKAKVLTMDRLRELYALCKRGPLVGITANFLDNFLDGRVGD